MKAHTLIFSLLSSSLLQAMPPAAGTTASDVTYALAENYNSGTRSFDSLTDRMLSNSSEKIILLAYATPW